MNIYLARVEQIWRGKFLAVAKNSRLGIPGRNALANWASASATKKERFCSNETKSLSQNKNA
jgi:hypothetical protein